MAAKSIVDFRSMILWRTAIFVRWCGFLGLLLARLNPCLESLKTTRRFKRPSPLPSNALLGHYRKNDPPNSLRNSGFLTIFPYCGIESHVCYTLLLQPEPRRRGRGRQAASAPPSPPNTPSRPHGIRKHIILNGLYSLRRRGLGLGFSFRFPKISPQQPLHRCPLDAFSFERLTARSSKRF